MLSEFFVSDVDISEAEHDFFILSKMFRLAWGHYLTVTKHNISRTLRNLVVDGTKYGEN